MRIAYLALPVAQYPEIAPPQVQIRPPIRARTPKSLAETVATPIEEQVNGVENMLYICSQMTNNGTVTITVTFSLGTNIDTAQVLVQNRVAIAQPRLPQEVQPLGVTTLKQSPDLMMVVHLFSPNNTYSQEYISNYALIQSQRSALETNRDRQRPNLWRTGLQHAHLAGPEQNVCAEPDTVDDVSAASKRRTCKWLPDNWARSRLQKGPILL